MLMSIVHLYVLLFVTTKIMHGESSCLCTETDSDFANGVNLVYHTCDEKLTTSAYCITQPQELLKMLKHKRIIFYIFGYLQFPEDPNVKMMIRALCHEKTDNVVLLDWSKYSREDYVTTFQNAEKIGSLFAQSLQMLVHGGLAVSKIYIVAHSLGAHIAGLTGKCSNFMIPRITGLDPANPFFYLPGCYLTHNDAVWVDVIHTDMGKYGAFTSMGTTDYYVNGGYRPQPNCKPFGTSLSEIDLCSHQRSVELYAKSKLHPITFTLMNCSNYMSYKLNLCNNKLHDGFGYTASNITL